MAEPDGSARLRRLMDRYVDGDTEALIGPEASGHATALLSATAPPVPYRTLSAEGLAGVRLDEPVLDAFHLLARFHAYRSQEYAGRGPEAPLAVDAAQASAVLFALVHRVRPGSVPPRLRGSVSELAGDLADLWRSYAVLLCGQGRAHGDAGLEDRGIAWLRGLAGHLPPGDPQRSDALVGLSGALYSRYQHRGNRADLDEAVETGLRGAEGRPPLDTGRGTALINVSLALRTRFEHFGLPADIHWAVDTGRRALAAYPADAADRPLVLGTLGATVRVLNEHTGNPAELTEAVSLLRRAVATIPGGHPFLATHRNNLGCALVRQYECGPRDGPLLDEAIEHLRRGAAQPHPRRGAYLANLGSALYRRWTDDPRPRAADLRESARVLAEAYLALGPHDPDRHTIGLLLGEVRRALRRAEE
ncbi:hypothetical protein AB0N16_20005 [Streptomyces sp. NPDC051105]|uniref:hypothetical protein n=1 Tax=Streptomyces sp. NPDC051105 TaxID=3154843 RepID=UPI00341688C6